VNAKEADEKRAALLEWWKPQREALIRLAEALEMWREAIVEERESRRIADEWKS
jgi:hypothetical protein